MSRTRIRPFVAITTLKKSDEGKELGAKPSQARHEEHRRHSEKARARLWDKGHGADLTHHAFGWKGGVLKYQDHIGDVEIVDVETRR